MSAFEEQSGKISDELFREILLPHCGAKRKEVITGPLYGVDTAVTDLGNGMALATSSDPLSLIPLMGMEASAWLSVHLLANDMATTGFAPQYAQFVLNLPSTLSQKAFREYWGHIHHLCKEMGVAITGGHTGQIEGQNSTISGGGTMFLTAPIENILTSNKASPGDAIVITKGAALSSSAILAMCFPQTVRNKVGKEIHDKACENFYRTSSLKEALIASATLVPNKELKAMHDVTEGGILGAIFEMAKASSCGFRVYNDALPISPEVKAVTDLFEIDPHLSIGAGSMIMAVKEDCTDLLINALNKQSIEASVAGSFCARQEGHIVVKNGKEVPFTFSGNDPYWAAFFKALKNGMS